MKTTLKDHNKSSILEFLRPIISSAEILPQYKITYEDWMNSKDIGNSIPFSEPYIVRSSSPEEDNEQTTNAGHFDSVLHVTAKNLQESIKKVFDSYGLSKEGSFVFVQPMLEDVSLSGVMFTKDSSSGSYYYIINYDDTSSNTDTVTSGSNNLLKVYYHFKNTDISIAEKNMQSILYLGKELEMILGQDNLDIEFAMTKSNKLYLFQVRTLHAPNPEYSLNDVCEIMEDIDSLTHKFFKPHPYLFGEKSILGVMPDWNPAEIIGIRPKKLALSMYKELITDRQWAYQRTEYGYRNVKSFPLIYDFNGLPYIDVRVSFNSFIPDSLDENIAQKLVTYYLKELRNNPHYHDKIEFYIVLSCFTFDLNVKLDKLRKSGFTETEISAIVESLKDLTNTIIKDNDNLTLKDYRKIEELKKRQKIIMSSNLSKEDKIYWLLEDCKRYGTLAFAGLARAGFISVELLKSLVSNEIFSEEDFQEFMKSVETISSNIYQDFLDLSKQDFLDKYGHLRPGSYDITTARYDEKKYFIEDMENQHYMTGDFKISLKTIQLLDERLKKYGLECSASSFLSFCKFAIEAREYGKFVFTKSLSDALKLLEELGKEYGISREDMAFFDIKDFYSFYTTSDNREQYLRSSINRGKKSYSKSLLSNFPPLIQSRNDFYSFVIREAQANYITMNTVTANTIMLSNLNQTDFELSGKIVLIPSADPGYDWIYSHNIAGLITKYGGVNSHMAIRSAELQIPSIIGCGELLFNHYSNAQRLYINCANQECKVLN